MKVLIADDEQKNLILLEDFFTGLGHEVMAAENGKIALEMARSNPPEIIISDILMPVMDGFKLCQEWNKDSRLKDIPFIFFTATYTSEDDEKFALGLGAARFIVKPFPMKKLIEIVNEIIKNRREGKLVLPEHTEITDETAVIKEHFVRMSRKLEDKLVQLEQARQVIYESEEKFRAIAHNAIDAIILIDNEGCISYWNPAAETIFGYKRNEAIGKQFHQLLAPNRFHDTIRKGFTRFKVTGKGAFIGKSIELEAIRKGGTEFPMELSLSALIVKGKRNALGIVRDISARQKADEKMRKLSHAVEQSASAVIITDSERVIEYVNPMFTQMSGYSADEVVGKKPDVFRSGELSSGVFSEIWETITAGKEWRGEFHNKKRTGELYWVSASVSAIRDSGGKISHYLSVQEDITEKKLLEKQLIQAQKMEAIGTLAGGVAHDFNNLLGVIIGYSDYLLTKLDKEDQMYKIMEDIRKAGQRGAGLTDQLLAFSRKQALKQEILALNGVVAETEKMLERLISEDIELTTDLEPELWLVKADQGQITQILMNLTINARDAMAQGGKIVIKTENMNIDEEFCQRFSYARPGQFVRLSVEDTGVGMDQEIMSHIFDPFFTTKEIGKGTGLGLSVIYGIVKQHEGWVNVYSEPGQGSVFRIYLPASFASEAKEFEEEVPIEELQGHGERVLLVEDERMLREFAVRTLPENGYVVFAAEKAEEALELFEREKGEFHIVFSDVVLPGINGVKLVDRLLVKKPELKVLLSSGYMEDKSQLSVIRKRGFNFLQKPYTLVELLKSLKETLQ